jgi:adenine deaminase
MVEVKPELHDRRILVDCAMGRVPADLVIRDGRWVCVQTGEIVPATDIAVKAGRIAYVGSHADHTIGADTRVIQAGGRFLAPGLLDAHMHVESGMLTITEFVRAVILHGTTGMFIDPHEIANVFGLRGVRFMVDEAALQPIHVWVEIPACVPSTPGFETSGAALGPEEVTEAMAWPGVVGLGEMMNFAGVINSDARMHAEMAATRQAGKVIGGHYPSPDLGLPFHAYAAGGALDDHEGTRMEDAVARTRQGMKALLRYGSAWLDMAEQVRAVLEMKLDPRHFLLCTDDCHSETLVHEGHMDRVVRHAISQGLAPVTALQMATLNTAEHFGLAHEVGQIAPGRVADILLVSDLVNLCVDTVIARGEVICDQGRVLATRPPALRPEWALNSVHLARALCAADFRLEAPSASEATVNVIGVIENQAPTRHLRLKLPVQDGAIRPSIGWDVAKAAVVERHQASGRVQVGLVQGFGFKQPCAIGSTVAHDCHQMIIVGTDEDSMALAANTLAKCGGGQVVVLRGRVTGLVELPIAGLMSDQPAETVARSAASLLNGFKACGCMLNNPNMQLSLLTLTAIPALRLSDLGLVDTNNFCFLPVVEK